MNRGTAALVVSAAVASISAMAWAQDENEVLAGDAGVSDEEPDGGSAEEHPTAVDPPESGARGSVVGSGDLPPRSPARGAAEVASLDGRPVPDAQVTDEPGGSIAPDGAADIDFVARGAFAQVSLHASFIGDLIDRPTLLLRWGYGVVGGYRFGSFGLFGLIEHNIWLSTELDLDLEKGALNVAAGVELFYFDRNLRASVAIGPSILLSDQALDSRGKVGLYVAARPTGIRFEASPSVVFQLDPLTFVVVAPVLGSPSIVDIQYRIELALELDFSRHRPRLP